MPDTPHRYYRHGNIGLRSQRGTIFRVYAAPFAEASTGFASMIDIAKTNHGTRGNPYHTREIPSSSKTIECFLQVMPSRNPRAPNLDFRNVLSLLELCVKYQINVEIKKPIKDKLVEKTGKEGAQWALLNWAGERKDDNFLFWDAMTKLPSLWQLTIWRPTIQTPGNKLLHEYDYKGKSNGSLEGFGIWMNWQMIADAFDPKPM
ncbi:hypothetical protein V866_006249 [Kwoniella sp. B9012]